ncbi:hypothetical protein JHK87_044911 [Glycine soja]|nr:hypothetical protein JHK87_044911 [Glycine soja]
MEQLQQQIGIKPRKVKIANYQSLSSSLKLVPQFADVENWIRKSRFITSTMPM